ncbi:hypothetical protein EV363DRAFT_1160795 [Boletus edulis]|nr:hypothetical protein EV363DRAFT_1160795 [Boletus edulis]
MRTIIRRALSSALNRPAPPPLPRDQQREFEQLQRAAQSPSSDAELTLHPDARKPIKPDFEGDINPLTGEQGGPKTEPVAKWVEEDNGDWSFKGRVSDF